MTAAGTISLVRKSFRSPRISDGRIAVENGISQNGEPTELVERCTASAAVVSKTRKKTPDKSQSTPDRPSQGSPPFTYEPVILELSSDGTWGFNPEAIVNLCLRQTGAKPGFMNAPGGAELLKCIEREQTEQAAQLGDRACNDRFCIYRLKQVADNTFSGSGYTLKHHVSSKPRKFGNQDLVDYESVLTRDDGKRAIMSQTVGPIGSIFFSRDTTSRPKSEIDATYYGPISVGTNAFVVLRVPQERVASDEDKKATAVSLPCQKAPTDSVPCELKWKTVEVKYETLDRRLYFRADGTVTTAPQNRRDIQSARSAKFVFGNNEDVYAFAGKEEGLAYKMNLEIDFLANPSRAPKDGYEKCTKAVKGRMDFQDNTLIQNLASEHSCDWNSSFKRTLKIKFSAEFSSCAVVEFSSAEMSVKPDRTSYMTDKQNFVKSVECRIYSAR